MNELDVKNLLHAVQEKQIDIDEACEKLKDLPYADLGFAKVDHHRPLRRGFPEVIYGETKTPEQIVSIMKELAKGGGNIMATRCDKGCYEQVHQLLESTVYFEQARIIALVQSEQKEGGVVAVVAAGTSDLPVAEEAAITAQLLGCSVRRVYDVGVAGIHRLFDKLEIIREADAVIAVAGMEGALASVVGGLVDVPVVAVPTSVGYGANFGGLSALLSMLNSCADGVGVVNIDNGYGAGCLASMIAKKQNPKSTL